MYIIRDNQFWRIQFWMVLFFDWMLKFRWLTFTKHIIVCIHHFFIYFLGVMYNTLLLSLKKLHPKWEGILLEPFSV